MHAFLSKAKKHEAASFMGVPANQYDRAERASITQMSLFLKYKQGCRDVQLKAENNRITVSPYATSCYHIYSTIAKKKIGSLKSKITTQRQISETAVHKYSSAVAGLYCIYTTISRMMDYI